MIFISVFSHFAKWNNFHINGYAWKVIQINSSEQFQDLTHKTDVEKMKDEKKKKKGNRWKQRKQTKKSLVRGQLYRNDPVKDKQSRQSIIANAEIGLRGTCFRPPVARHFKPTYIYVCECLLGHYFLSAITVHSDPYRYIKGLYLWPAISISTLHWILYDEQAA